MCQDTGSEGVEVRSEGRGRAVSAAEWDALAAALDARVAACAELPFQSVPGIRTEVEDALSGRRVLLNAGRAGRPRSRSAADAYREGRTPPTLAFVPADGAPAPVVEGEEDTFAAVRRMLGAGTTVASSGVDPGASSGTLSPWDVVESFGGRTRVAADGTRVPLVFPSVPWRARVFFNLSPIVADRSSGANGFVVAVAPEFEAGDLGRLMAGGAAPSGVPAPAGATAAAAGPAPPGARAADGILPPPVFDAVIHSWALLERWAERRDLLPVPFINGGKGRASGQSLDCFHAQFYALEPRPLPPFHAALERAESGMECPLCALVSSPSLEVTRTGSVGVWAHPAPEVEATLVAAAIDHQAAIASLPDPADFARAISAAVRGYETLLGGVPPYNVSVRCGRYAGHLHAEVIPRAGVAVAAGFEKATGLWVSTRPPADVAAALRAGV